jgi:Fe-S cluster biogenesis protein NfuA
MLKDISHFHLFRDLRDSDLKLVEPLFSARNYSADDVLFEQGQKAEYFYLVADGELIIRYKPYDGEEIVVTRLHDGSVAGWSAVLGNEAYTSSAICGTDMMVFQMSGEDLRQLVAEHPETARVIMDRLAAAVSPRWRDAQEQVKSMLHKGTSPFNFKPEEGAKMSPATDTPQREDQLKALIDQLSAYIETYHGGSVEYVDYDGKVLKVHLGGACLGCPLSPATLHGWVEGTVRQFFPEITQVVAV